MAAYFNATQVKKDQPLTIELDNGLEVTLRKLPTGSLKATNTWTGEEFCTGAAGARAVLAKWEEQEEPVEEQLDIVEHTQGQQVGYVRVSTVEQSTDRQLSGVKLDKIFSEKVSAKTVARPELTACLEYVRKGDTLHIHSLDRVCRSGASDAVALVETMTAKGVTVQFHKEGMRFDGCMSAAQKGVLSILASVAEMERGLIRERQAEGIAIAKASGKHMGRPKANVSKDDVMRLKGEGKSMAAIARELGIGRATLYRLMDEPK